MIISELVDKGREALEFERGNLVRERLSIFHGSLSPDNSLMYDLVINFYDTILHQQVGEIQVDRERETERARVRLSSCAAFVSPCRADTARKKLNS